MTNVAAVTSGPSVCDIGSRLEPFVDDWLIEEMTGVSLRLHHPERREVALAFDRAWEGPISYDQVVIKEGDRYRLWYRAGGDASQRTAYAESTNGVHWVRPELGLFEYGGSRQNNIVIQGETARAVCVFKDGNPAAPSNERYKATGLGSKHGDRATLRGLTSPDGIHWTPIATDPIIIAPDDGRPWFDTHNVAFWDTDQKQYVAYLRGWLPPGVRAIRRSTSPDFHNWSVPEFIDLGDTPVEHLYKNGCTQYFRAAHVYLMFPKRFVPERTFVSDWPHQGVSDTVFMSSRDGVRWDRRFMEAFIRPGPDVANWNERNLYAGVGVVPTGPAEMSMYVVEHFRHPSAHLRRMVLRTDGFVSVNAPYGGGEFLTKPLIFSGGELVVNYSTSAVGSVRVEVQDSEGGPVEGYHLGDSADVFGDEIERVVGWRGGSDLSALAGRQVRLRVQMKDADLYSIRFR